jgi:dTDP-4-dehydrorhamnose reductase
MAATEPGTILVVGGDAILGAAVVASLEACGRRVIATSRRRGPAPLDLASDADTWPIPAGVTAACICAAVTSIEDCRRFPRAAEAVNVTGTTTLARRLVAAGVRVVFPSSSLVFDGTRPQPRPETPPSPVTAYGRLKAAAETELLALGPAVTVVRLSKVIHPGMSLFETWRQRLRAGLPIQPFTDLRFAPLDLRTAATALTLACSADVGGILQLSASEDLSYAEAARHLAAAVGYDAGLIRPASGQAAGLDPDQIVRHATLDSTRLEELTGLVPPAPWAALDPLVREWSERAAPPG